GQLSAAAIDQHGQAHAVGPAVVIEFVEHGAYGAARVEHVVEHQDVGAVDVEVNLRLGAGGHAALREIVAVQGRGQHAGRARQVQVLVQALDQPGAARSDARQARRSSHEAAHAAQQFTVQRLGVQHQA